MFILFWLGAFLLKLGWSRQSVRAYSAFTVSKNNFKNFFRRLGGGKKEKITKKNI